MRFRFRRNGWWVVVFATMLVFAAINSGLASADQNTEQVYVDGQTYQINPVSPPIFDAGQSLLDLASPIYILGYPVPAGTSGPITLPSGYQPSTTASRRLRSPTTTTCSLLYQVMSGTSHRCESCS
jgi:hypothetical protein